MFYDMGSQRLQRIAIGELKGDPDSFVGRLAIRFGIAIGRALQQPPVARPMMSRQPPWCKIAAPAESIAGDADVAKLVDAADFDRRSARRETGGAELPKLGER
jgi:hypothetical protein